MSSDPRKAARVPAWQLVLLGLVRAVQGLVFPIGRMWRSSDPLDTFGLVQMTSVAGDALLAIALADSIFFSLPVGEAKWRVAAYLALTMLPLALAGPLLVPLLDRAGPRRSITVIAALGRAIVAAWGITRLDTLALFPVALVILVLSKVHTITKNGLTMAYVPSDRLLQANARLGRIAVAGAVVAAPLGYIAIRAFGSGGAMVFAAAAYAAAAILGLRLPRPARRGPAAARAVGPRGRLHVLTGPAIGAIGMRAASGFILFLLAFSLREGDAPAWWFAVLAGAGILGSFVADLLAPNLPTATREEAVVIACVSAAAIGGILAFELFGLPLLALFAFVVGAAAELGRLAFQALMQRHAPEGAVGRVFVRYEVLFQLAWVGGALLPAMLPIDFRVGILLLTGFYLFLAGVYVWRAHERRSRARLPQPPQPPRPDRRGATG